MKTWKFSFFLFWMAIGFAACQDSSKHIYPRYEQFPETYNKSCVQEIGNDSVLFRYPYRIDIKDSLVILLDLHNDSHFLYAFTFPDWQPITPFGKRGEGPNEILSAERMRICSPDSIWVLDSNRAQITRWKVSVADKKAERMEEIPLDKRLLRTLDFCKTDSGFLVTDYTGSYRYHVLDAKGRIQKSIGSIPTEDESLRESLPALAQAWRTFMSYNPKNQVLALVTQLGETVEIFNLKTGFHTVLFGPNGEPVFSQQGGEAFPKGIKGFNEVLVADSCIYAVFDGVSFKERIRNMQEGKELPDGGYFVYVFNLEGKPLRKLALDHSVFGLALQGERLYTTSLDNNNPVLSYSAISSTLKQS